MILIIGNFGGKGNRTNGQIGRTQNIYKCIKLNTDEKIHIVDTSYGIQALLRNMALLLKARIVVVLPAQKALKPILKLMHITRKIDQTIYVAIGGWITAFVREDEGLKKLCSRCKKVFVQLDSMTVELQNLGLKNAATLPNFRIYDNQYCVAERNHHIPWKLLFYARVDESKGIELLMDSLKDLSYEFELDIYGPVAEGYKTKLTEMTKDKRIKYKGVLSEKHLETIGNYDILCFPTHYDGEGFPGTILEAIYAGVPIIASDWKYNREIIERYNVGTLFDTFSANSLRTTLENMMRDNEMWRACRNHCVDAAKELSAVRIGERLLNEL
ncbi:MAG: glycosyltransferase [Oscillospiraceae bacterium]|nr:glycosyltransferase [Oscillospiraceae bacterium]